MSVMTSAKPQVSVQEATAINCDYSALIDQLFEIENSGMSGRSDRELARVVAVLVRRIEFLENMVNAIQHRNSAIDSVALISGRGPSRMGHSPPDNEHEEVEPIVEAQLLRDHLNPDGQLPAGLLVKLLGLAVSSADAHHVITRGSVSIGSDQSLTKVTDPLLRINVHDGVVVRVGHRAVRIQLVDAVPEVI